MRVGFLFAVSFFLFLKSSYLFVIQIDMVFKLFAILQKYEFSSKSQPYSVGSLLPLGCLRYCKSTSFQANHNKINAQVIFYLLFAILQKYEFSSKSQRTSLQRYCASRCLRYCKSTSFQANHNSHAITSPAPFVVCDTAKVRVFKQITTCIVNYPRGGLLFAILQKYEFSSKSQRFFATTGFVTVVCDTAKVRVFKQITTNGVRLSQ